MMMVFVILVLLIAVFANGQLRRKIFVRYTSKSKQNIEKFVSMKAGSVIFEDKSFNIVPSCTKLYWYNRGLQQLFPTWVILLEYTWESQNPIDPNTGKPVVFSPEVGKAIDQESRFRSYATAQNAAMNKTKMGGFSQFIPWIGLIAVALLGVYIYPKLKDIDIIKKTLSDILIQLGNIPK